MIGWHAVDTIGPYVLLFVAVMASWAGVPFIGATAAGAAGAAASQGTLNLTAVIVVSTVAGEVGGLIGYAIGDRWGRSLLERPGKRQESRVRLVERGERVYERWGPLAVFITPAIVSGTAKMRHRQFVVWNGLASLGFSFSVAASAYGIGRLLSGYTSPSDIGTLVVGLGVGALIGWLFIRRHRRRQQRRAAGNASSS